MLSETEFRPDGRAALRSQVTYENGDPNLTPVLDTIFLVLAVLLVVFVKLTPVEGLPAVLGPNGKPTGSYERSQRVEVMLLADGRLEVNGQDVPIDALTAAIDAQARRRAIDAVYVLAHIDVPYGAVAEVLAYLYRLNGDRERGAPA